MHVASLHVYPIKGARGVALERAEVLHGGLRHDRRFMVLDQRGAFVTQREHPRMALVQVTVDGDRLTVSSPAPSRASIPIAPEGYRRRVRVWRDEVEAIDVAGEGAAFFSDLLQQRCSLVFMPLDVIRPIEEPHGGPGDRVGFADAYPVLIASLASLADLNQRLLDAGAEPVSMDRFRPNIVVQGGAPYAEDLSRTAHIGSLTFRTPKRCSRCQVTNVDPTTGEKGTEPLRTLASYRAEGNKTWFAMNAIPNLDADGSAFLAVGDRVRYDEAMTAHAQVRDR